MSRPSPVPPTCPYARCVEGGVELRVAAAPNAKRTEVAGLHADALRVRVHAPAVEGRANEELLRWLARQLDVPMSALTLVRGAQARRKTVRCAVAAQERDAVWGRVCALWPPEGGGEAAS